VSTFYDYTEITLYNNKSELFSNVYIWKGGSSVKEVEKILNVFGYTIDTSDPEVELTMDQIAEKFGIDVDKLSIKK